MTAPVIIREFYGAMNRSWNETAEECDSCAVLEHFAGTQCQQSFIIADNTVPNFTAFTWHQHSLLC